jgi:septum formation protein
MSTPMDANVAPLILASSSPRRKQLLEMAELSFEIITKDTDESFPEDMETGSVPVYVAKKKAMAIWQQHTDRTIVAADTVVVLDDEIIGKPKDKSDAMDILSKLSGRTHKVITGVVWIRDGVRHELAETTEVTFYALSQEQIEYYIEKYTPYDKAGAYAIQEWIGVIGIREIKGCFYNVMGFPISRFLATFFTH